MHGTKNFKIEKLHSVSNFQCSSYCRICSSCNFFRSKFLYNFLLSTYVLYVRSIISTWFNRYNSRVPPGVLFFTLLPQSFLLFLSLFSLACNLPNYRLHVCDTKLDILSGFSVTVTCYNKCRTISPPPPLLPITRCLIKLLLYIHPLSTSPPSEPQYRIE